MLKKLLPLIPEHECYAEAFAGGLALLLAKERSDVEVVNDANKELVILYRQVQFHLPELEREIEFILNARENLKSFRTEKGITEIQIAARFFIRNRISFGGGRRQLRRSENKRRRVQFARTEPEASSGGKSAAFAGNNRVPVLRAVSRTLRLGEHVLLSGSALYQRKHRRVRAVDGNGHERVRKAGAEAEREVAGDSERQRVHAGTIQSLPSAGDGDAQRAIESANGERPVWGANCHA